MTSNGHMWPDIYWQPKCIHQTSTTDYEKNAYIAKYTKQTHRNQFDRSRVWQLIVFVDSRRLCTSGYSQDPQRRFSRHVKTIQ